MERQRPLKIAYVSHQDPEDVRAWSGLIHHIAASLQHAGADLTCLHGFRRPRKVLHGIRKIVGLATGKEFVQAYEPEVMEATGRQIAERLPTDIDAIFSPSSQLVAAAAPFVNVPLFFYIDATVGGMRSFYRYFSQLSERSACLGHGWEDAAIRRCRLAFFASEWARDSAIEHHQLRPERGRVVPFGANVALAEAVDQQVQSKVSAPCEDRPPRLLFVGKDDWARKGGNRVVRVFEALRQQVPGAVLTVAGPEKPPPELPDSVDFRGFLSRAVPSQRDELEALYLEADFLIVLSESEAYGLVYAEAMAFGAIPVANRCGGVPTLIPDESVGLLAEPDEPADSIAGRLVDLFRDRYRLAQVRRKARQRYETVLNWRVAGATLLREIERALAEESLRAHG